MLADLLRVLDRPSVRTRTPACTPARERALATVDGSPVGAVGEIDPGVLDAFGIDERVAYLEVDLGALLRRPPPPRTHRPVSRFPSSDIDLAFDAPETVSDGRGADAVRNRPAGPVGAAVRLVPGAQIGDGRRSLPRTGCGSRPRTAPLLRRGGGATAAHSPR